MQSQRLSRFAILILILALSVYTSGRSRGASESSPDAKFQAFYEAFISAVRANDKNKIADLIEFPVSAWAVQTNGNIQEVGIADKADFLSKYDSLFTSAMRSHALKTKPQKIRDDQYSVIWHDTDLEYSFEFERKPNREFRLTMYLIGPR